MVKYAPSISIAMCALHVCTAAKADTLDRIFQQQERSLSSFPGIKGLITGQNIVRNSKNGSAQFAPCEDWGVSSCSFERHYWAKGTMYRLQYKTFLPDKVGHGGATTDTVDIFDGEKAFTMAGFLKEVGGHRHPRSGHLGKHQNGISHASYVAYRPFYIPPDQVLRYGIRQSSAATVTTPFGPGTEVVMKNNNGTASMTVCEREGGFTYQYWTQSAQGKMVTTCVSATHINGVLIPTHWTQSWTGVSNAWEAEYNLSEIRPLETSDNPFVADWDEGATVTDSDSNITYLVTNGKLVVDPFFSKNAFWTSTLGWLTILGIGGTFTGGAIAYYRHRRAVRRGPGESAV